MTGRRAAHRGLAVSAGHAGARSPRSVPADAAEAHARRAGRPPAPVPGPRPRSRRRLVPAALGLLGLAAVWQVGAALGGPFVLPGPAAVVRRVGALSVSGAIWAPAGATALHVLAGYGLGGLAGLLSGLLAGLVEALGTALSPLSTLILGVPPIVWVVLALFWLGPGGGVAVLTVAVGVAPVVFAGALAGARATRPDLEELSAAFGASWRQRLWEIRAPQLAITLRPALAVALGLAWKVSLMAEVLGGGTGLGGRIAEARAYLDLCDVMAWVVVALALLMASDGLLGRLMRGLAAE